MIAVVLECNEQLTFTMAILLAPFLTKNKSITPSPSRDAGAMGMSCEMNFVCRTGSADGTGSCRCNAYR